MRPDAALAVPRQWCGPPARVVGGRSRQAPKPSTCRRARATPARRAARATTFVNCSGPQMNTSRSGRSGMLARRAWASSVRLWRDPNAQCESELRAPIQTDAQARAGRFFCAREGRCERARREGGEDGGPERRGRGRQRVPGRLRGFRSIGTGAIVRGCRHLRVRLFPTASRTITGMRRNRSGRTRRVMTARGRAIPTS